MTREELTSEDAIEVIKAYQANLINSVSNQLDGDIKAFDMAIQALEQEPKIDILKQIRADIKHTYEQEKEIDTKWAAGLKYSLKIIDKAMSEVSE